MNKNHIFLAILLIVVPFSNFSVAEGQGSFAPTWKLLDTSAKEQFIAGYLEGWRDAGVINDIASEYIKENPTKALEGLERVKALYDLSSLKAAAIVKKVDEFYKNPANQASSLSRAVSYAKAGLEQ